MRSWSAASGVRSDGSILPSSSSRSRKACSFVSSGRTADTVSLHSLDEPRSDFGECAGVQLASTQRRSEPSHQVCAVVFQIPHRHGSPVSPVHGAVADEGDPEARPVEIADAQNVVAVKQVSRLPARQKRRELPRHEFMPIDQRNLSCQVAGERVGIGSLEIPQRLSEHVVQIHIEVPGLTGEADIAQPPFATGVRSRRPAERRSPRGRRPPARCPQSWCGPPASRPDPARRHS